MTVAKFSVSLASEWWPFLIPSGGMEPDYRTMVIDVPADLAALNRLSYGLEQAWSFASRGVRENSERWVMVSDPAAGRVDAVLSIDFLESGPHAEQTYFELASGASQSTPSLDVINRTVAVRAAHPGVVVLVHDFILPVGDRLDQQEHPATERAIAAVFPEGLDIAVEMAIVTQDLGLFDDLESTMMGIVDHSTFLPETDGQ